MNTFLNSFKTIPLVVVLSTSALLGWSVYALFSQSTTGNISQFSPQTAPVSANQFASANSYISTTTLVMPETAPTVVEEKKKVHTFTESVFSLIPRQLLVATAVTSTQAATTAAKEVTTNETDPVLPNPAAQCLPAKDQWNAFINSFNDAYGNTGDMLDRFDSYAFGTDNKPLNTTDLYIFNYRVLASNQDELFSRINATRANVEKFTAPSVMNTEDFARIKHDFSSSLDSLVKSYGLALKAYEIFATNQTGDISDSDQETTRKLLESARDEFTSAKPDLLWMKTVISQYQTQLAHPDAPLNGCSFSFNEDGTIAAVSADEQSFIAQYPRSQATAEGDALITIQTPLPLTVQENGEPKSAMRFVCDGESLGLTRIDNHTVGHLIPKSNDPKLMRCSFGYRGSGNEISSKTIDLTL